MEDALSENEIWHLPFNRWQVRLLCKRLQEYKDWLKDHDGKRGSVKEILYEMEKLKPTPSAVKEYKKGSSGLHDSIERFLRNKGKPEKDKLVAIAILLIARNKLSIDDLINVSGIVEFSGLGHKISDMLGGNVQEVEHSIGKYSGSFEDNDTDMRIEIKRSECKCCLSISISESFYRIGRKKDKPAAIVESNGFLSPIDKSAGLLFVSFGEYASAAAYFLTKNEDGFSLSALGEGRYVTKLTKCAGGYEQ